MSNTLFVRVERLPFGATSFSEATADFTDDDKLIVSCTDKDYDRKHGPMQVYRSGTWVEAQVVDQHGKVQFAFLSKHGQALREARDASLRERKTA